MDGYIGSFDESCVFSRIYKNQQTTVILPCCSAHVSNYISKGSVVVETKEGGLDKVIISVQNKINAVATHDED